MDVLLEPATSVHLGATLAWLKEQWDAGLGGFYCNRLAIEHSFADGHGICAMHNGVPVGFVLFEHCGNEGAINLVEVRPSYRRQGVADRLMAAAENQLRGRGAQCIDVECTSGAGEALCRQLGYEDYEDDPRNYRAPNANPTLRKYLSAWRPKPRHPWS